MKRRLELRLDRQEGQDRVEVMSRIDGQADFAASHSFSMQNLEFDGKRLRIDQAYFSEYGNRLYRSLFIPETGAENLLKTKPHWIVLVLTDERLHSIPWEYARLGKDVPVAECLFSRCAEEPGKHDPKAEEVKGPRIVALVSSPLASAYSSIRVSDEWDALRDSLNNSMKSVEVRRAVPATVEKMSDSIIDQTDAIVHFMGHGGYDSEKDGGYLVFEKENGNTDIVFANEMNRYVKGKARVVVLNACETAKSTEGAFNSLAAVLSTQGIPYALGMRFRVSDPEALSFSREFYNKIGNGASVEEAVRYARNSLLREFPERGAFGLPVLYSSQNREMKFLWAKGAPRISEPEIKSDLQCLPPAQGGYVGRLEELREIGELLIDGHVKMLTIVGPGGQGKTALAREAAQRFAYAWPGGVCAISLEVLPTRESVAASLATFYGIERRQGPARGETEAAVIEYLRSNKALIIIDNAETVVDCLDSRDEDIRSAAKSLAELIVSVIPDTRACLLATSRRPFECAVERPLHLAGLNARDGAELFMALAAREGKGENARGSIAGFEAMAYSLSKKLAGNPLGLRLLGLAFRKSECAPGDFLESCERALLDGKDKYETERHATLYSCFDFSIRALEGDLLEILKRAAIFHSPFPPEMAEAVFCEVEIRGNSQFVGTLMDIGASEYLEGNLKLGEDLYETDLPLGDSTSIYLRLNALWRRGFLDRELKTVSEEGRTFGAIFYRLTPVIRIYLEKAFDLSEADPPLERRFGEAYAELARTVSAEMTTNPIKRYIFDRCVEDLERGCEFVPSERKEEYRLSLYSVFSYSGDAARARKYGPAIGTKTALSRTQSGFLRPERILAGMKHASESGELEKALELGESALEQGIASGDELLRGHILHELGITRNELGDFENALDCLKKAKRIFEKAKDRNNTANSLNGMALVMLAMQEPKKALDFLRDAAKEIEKTDARGELLKDVSIEADIMHNTGVAYRGLKMPEMAKGFLERALALRIKGNDGTSICATEYMLALACAELGQDKEAAARYERAEQAAIRAGHEMVRGCCILNRSRLMKSADPLAAKERMEETVGIFERMGSAAYEATARFDLAMLMAESFQDFQGASNNLEHAIRLMDARGLKRDAAGVAIEVFRKMLLEADRNRKKQS
jgi:tetratricopeptide (TPR) repeat protein